MSHNPSEPYLTNMIATSLGVHYKTPAQIMKRLMQLFPEKQHLLQPGDIDDESYIEELLYKMVEQGRASTKEGKVFKKYVQDSFSEEQVGRAFRESIKRDRRKEKIKNALRPSFCYVNEIQDIAFGYGTTPLSFDETIKILDELVDEGYAQIGSTGYQYKTLKQPKPLCPVSRENYA